MNDLDVVILAAGKGTRMGSSIPKVLHNLAGKTLVEHAVQTAKELQPRNIIVVVGYGEDKVKTALNGEQVVFVSQESQLGTAHAVQQALTKIEAKRTLILLGDVPRISVKTLETMLQTTDPVCVLTQSIEDPSGYGRIIRDKNNKITSIVEEKDANAAERDIKETNTGIFCIETEVLEAFLSNLKNENATGEYYLTDVVAYARSQNKAVNAEHPNWCYEANGVNDKRQLATMERQYQKEVALKLLGDGVTIADANRIDVRGNLKCGRDVSIDIGCIFEGDVKIGDNVTIEAYSIIRNSVISSNTKICSYSHIEEASIGEHNEIGPYARIRPGTTSSSEVKIGNFVEVKASKISKNSKANHLSYIGDADVGASVNIGAGTITCNYDGANKHKTVLEDNVFVGSDTQLVAPVKIGRGSTIGAGSTITKDVPANSLAITRAKQTIVEHWERPDKTKKQR